MTRKSGRAAALIGIALYIGTVARPAAILPEKPKQELQGAIRHIGHGFDARPNLVIASQEIGLAGQVFFDRLPDTAVEKLGVWCGVEEAIEIGRIVKRANVPFCRVLPFDQRQHSPWVVLQNSSVFLKSVQDRRRDWKDHAGRVESAPGQDVMDQVAVNSSVSVLERMNVDKSKGQRRRRDHGIESADCVGVESAQAVDQ